MQDEAGKKSAAGLIKEYHPISMEKYGSGPGTGIRNGTYSGRHRRTGREKTPPGMNARISMACYSAAGPAASATAFAAAVSRTLIRRLWIES